MQHRPYGIHFITYANHRYERSRQRIIEEAKNFGVFETTTGFTPNDLSDEFKNKFKNILCLSRGAGYWIWKYDIIMRKLNEINEGDYIVYADAGCTINKNGIDRFFEYIDMLDKSSYGILSFQMGGLLEKWYTVKEIFDYFDIGQDHTIRNSGQFVGGILIIKKNDHSRLIFNKFYELLCNNINLITDSYNSFNQSSYFRDNRHDQSALSVIRKIHGSVVIPDETWFGNFACNGARKIPILATRLH